MINGSEEIDYRYLNLETNKFCADQEVLVKEINNIPKAKLLFVTNIEGQVLVAGGNKNISQCQAIIACKRLSGILRKNNEYQGM